MKNLLMIVLGVAVAMTAGPAVAATYYANSSQIDLCAFRDNITSSSSGGAADQVLHPVGYADTRFSPDSNGKAWWQVDFSGAYSVSDYSFRTYGDLYSSFTYQIDVFDGEKWFSPTGPITLEPDLTRPITINTGTTLYKKNQPYTSEGETIYYVPGFISGSFPEPVENIQAVRFTVLDYSGTYSDVCLAVAHLTGPNENIAVSPNLSLAQTVWSGAGAVTLNGVNTPLLNDNFRPVDRYIYGVSYSASEAAPAEIIVPLNDLYAVSSVALSTITDGRTAKDVRIWVSPDAEGDNWILVTNKGKTDHMTLPQQSYHEIDFINISEEAAYDAQRVRFDVLSTYQNGSGFITQVYVYGSAVPEPATMTLLTLGGLVALRRRGRR